MYKLTLLLALATFTFLAAPNTTTAQNTPRVYIMMKGGKLSEMVNGKKQDVKQDIILVNGTTIHPDGSIDDRDGHKRQLQEGEYMTMDGRIRKLKDMGGSGTKPASGQ
ncbi:DUF6799 domain-containing protein [Puia dinghuensis]|uniref:DUF6799 domain-containing protein n=1 Tax=Puia dinghuensis TaxID=1792502 RepID=A0A8J2UJ22_9BACT|nr:DUF6799 domain-containing protein [Puia dinghuensis]GGB24663.1 hypothetical protein GCM10011511_55770 [Puia dinghuensis]